MTKQNRHEWPKVPIQEVYLGLYDGPHATPKPADDGPVFLGIGNITEDGHLDVQEVRHIAEEDYPQWTRRVAPRPGDIVFTYEATLNRYAIIPEGFRGCLGRRLALIRPNPKKVDTRFLHYQFFGEKWRRTVTENTILGATVDRIPLVRFPWFPVALPLLPVQRRIASVLSAYDDLIENNTRRIRILEEMAQANYREWFVHFRFPGHKKVKRVPSPLGPIPEGWEVTHVAEAFEICGGATPSTKNPEYWENGHVVWFSPSDLTAANAMFMLDSAKKITDLGLESCSARLFAAYSVMLTSRATIGVVSLNTTPACTNQGFITCLPNERVSAYHIYFWLRENKEKIISLASGATFKEISKATFRQIPFMLPPQPIASCLTETLAPLAKNIEILLRKNVNLRKTRDYLLPKLISGELDVSDLDIKMEGAA